MKKIIANTLQEALIQASSELCCSVTELEYEVIQNESKGFLGLGKKQAIIIANNKSGNKSDSKTTKSNQDFSHFDSSDSSASDFFDASEFITKETPRFQTKEEIIKEITDSIKELLSYMPYRIDKVEVSFFDAQTLYIFLDGQDSALLIGERGYRYKAVSYLLFNWIQPTYGYSVRLEIAEFLKNQEEAIDIYLTGIINEIKREGRAQTKPLDGILAFIALKKLREHFPDKYISFRQNAQEERYIIINDFYR